jgi:hypothetical protein
VAEFNGFFGADDFPVAEGEAEVDGRFAEVPKTEGDGSLGPKGLGPTPRLHAMHTPTEEW